MPVATIGGRSGNDFSGVQDAVLISAFATTNFSAESDSATEPFVIRFDLSGIAGPVTVSDAVLTLAVTSGQDDPATFHFKRVLRAWVEAQATWNIFATSSNWTTAGCLSDGNDRSATDSCTMDFPGGFFAGDLNSTGNAALIADVEAFINGTLTNNGWRVDDAGAGNALALPANATAALRPLLTVTYSAEGGGQVSHRNGIALSAISAINGITKSGISHINGLTI